MTLTPKTWLQIPGEEKQEYWWYGSSTEAGNASPSEYDVGGLDLGAETPRSNGSTTSLLDNTSYVRQWAEAGIAVPRAGCRDSLGRGTSSSLLKDRSNQRYRSNIARDEDRDCGICFEYAVRPCKTLCCGKIFCTEHLADWLHGPNAEGRCPNCENACSLAGGTVSLSAAPLIPLSLLPNPPTTSSHVVYHPSPLHHRLYESMKHYKNPPPSSEASTSTFLSSEIVDSASCSDEEADSREYYLQFVRPKRKSFTQLGSASASAINLSTTPFSSSWGAISRLMGIITFLMFLYKLLS